MGEVRVHWCGDDLTSNLPELIGSIAESDDLSRTNKGEIQRIEEKDDVLSCNKALKRSKLITDENASP